MMLYPAISDLEAMTKSRYALVIVTAKRARQLLENSEKNDVQLADKPVKLAIDDIANGRVRCKEEVIDSAIEASEEDANNVEDNTEAETEE